MDTREALIRANVPEEERDHFIELARLLGVEAKREHLPRQSFFEKYLHHYRFVLLHQGVYTGASWPRAGKILKLQKEPVYWR